MGAFRQVARIGVALALSSFSSIAFGHHELESVAVSVLDLPSVDVTYLPFGPRTSPLGNISVEGPLTTYNQAVPLRAPDLDNRCGVLTGVEAMGWYVMTNHNSDQTYLGQDYPNRSFHPGEDWNVLGGDSDDVCQPIYPIAPGKLIATNDGHGFGYTAFVLHQIEDEYYVSVVAHLFERPAISPSDTLLSVDSVVGFLGATETGSEHLHWELRTSAFLECADSMEVSDLNDCSDGLVRLREERDLGTGFYPASWPALGFNGVNDRGNSFISENYVDPTDFVSSHANEPVAFYPGYVNFREGRTGVPGDGVEINAGEGDAHFTFVTPISFDEAPGNGSTSTVFFNETGITWRTSAIFRANGTCIVDSADDGMSAVPQTITINGVTGYVFSSSPAINDARTEFVRSECGQDIPLSEIEWIGVNLWNVNTGEPVPLDAYYFGWGEDVFPGTNGYTFRATAQVSGITGNQQVPGGVEIGDVVTIESRVVTQDANEFVHDETFGTIRYELSGRPENFLEIGIRDQLWASGPGFFVLARNDSPVSTSATDQYVWVSQTNSPNPGPDDTPVSFPGAISRNDIQVIVSSSSDTTLLPDDSLMGVINAQVGAADSFTGFVSARPDGFSPNFWRISFEIDPSTVELIGQ